MPIEPFDAAARQPGEPAWTRWLVLAASYVFYPLRHPIQFLALALAVYLLFSALLGPGSGPGSPGGFAAVRQSADKALSSVSSFINEQILRKPKEVAAMPAKPAPTPAPLAASPSPSPTPSPSPPSATPSAAPAAASPPRTISPAPSANVSASPVPPSAAPSTPVDPWVAPALPPVQTPRREAKAAPPSRSATNCIPGRDNRYPGSCAPYEDSRSRAFDEIIPEVIRRKSRVAGPCVGGIGGCYWGGFHY
jgi:hypothetical protein